MCSKVANNHDVVLQYTIFYIKCFFYDSYFDSCCVIFVTNVKTYKTSDKKICIFEVCSLDNVESMMMKNAKFFDVVSNNKDVICDFQFNLNHINISCLCCN